MISYRFVNVVWGPSFTDTFVNVCLPSTLTNGNLGYLAARGHLSYHIYTTARDAQTIRESQAFARLASLAQVEIVIVAEDPIIDDPSAVGSSPNRYHVMSNCHRHFIRAAGREDVALVFLSPDLFWADDSFAFMANCMDRGRRVIMMSALRVAKEDFLSDIQRRRDPGNDSLCVGKRPLVRLALDRLHPDTQSLCWGSPSGNLWPSLLLWRVAHSGLLLRAFHLHPLVVRPARRDFVPPTTIDDDYINHACPDPNDVEIVVDSDQMVAFELSKRTARADVIGSTPETAESVAAWAQQYANAKHRSFVRHKIRIHSDDLSADWERVETESDAVLAHIISGLGNA